jgi:cilia- and flagella-associated protein 251
VSDDNKFFATSDADCCVSLFKYDHYMWDTEKPIEWFFLGKHRTHTLEITSICFGQMLDADNNVQ